MEKKEHEADDSEQHHTLIKALTSLKYHPEPIWNPDDLKRPKFFGPKTVRVIKKRREYLLGMPVRLSY